MLVVSLRSARMAPGRPRSGALDHMVVAEKGMLRVLCRGAMALMLAAPVLLSAGAAEAQSRQRGSQPAATPSRGQVFIEGRWVSSAWCNATVPGGGGGGPTGQSLCGPKTPRR